MGKSFLADLHTMLIRFDLEWQNLARWHRLGELYFYRTSPSAPPPQKKRDLLHACEQYEKNNNQILHGDQARSCDANFFYTYDHEFWRVVCLR